jgi:hypothetical protein
MGFAGYVAVCVQLYCRGKMSLFHTTCFGLYGHLQVCRMLLLSCSWRNLLRWFFCILHMVTFCAWLRFCTFSSVGWVKYEVLLIIYAISYLWYICFLLTCVFLLYFSRFILLFLACVFICLTFRVCLVLPRAKCNHIQDTEKTNEADSVKNMRVITSYTAEDGHIGRNV